MQLPNLVPCMILSLLDGDSLAAAELVSQAWGEKIADGSLWKKLITKKVQSDALWRWLGEKKEWIESLSKYAEKSHSYYRQLHRDTLNVRRVLTIFEEFLTYLLAGHRYD